MNHIPVCFVLQPHMPLFSIYSLALEQDQEQSVGLQLANATLHNQTFIQVDVLAILFSVPVIPRPTPGCVVCSRWFSVTRSTKRNARRSRSTGYELRENW